MKRILTAAVLAFAAAFTLQAKDAPKLHQAASDKTGTCPDSSCILIIDEVAYMDGCGDCDCMAEGVCVCAPKADCPCCRKNLKKCPAEQQEACKAAKKAACSKTKTDGSCGKIKTDGSCGKTKCPAKTTVTSGEDDSSDVVTDPAKAQEKDASSASAASVKDGKNMESNMESNMEKKMDSDMRKDNKSMNGKSSKKSGCSSCPMMGGN